MTKLHEDAKRVALRLHCRVGDFGEPYSTRPILAEGKPVDVELEACKAEGAFTSKVQQCDPPLFNNDEGDLVLWVAVPVSYTRFFETASECKLKISVREVAQCEIKEATIVD